MSAEHVLTLNWNRVGDQEANNVTVDADQETNMPDMTVPNGGNIVVNTEIDVSNLRLLYIISDQDVTLTTNDDGTPDDTFTLLAGKPLVWYFGCGLPNPFASAVDVETFKLDNAGANDANVSFYCLQNSVT